MDPVFVSSDPNYLCFVAPTPGKLTSPTVLESGFTVFMGSKVQCYESQPFSPFKSDMKLRLKLFNKRNVSTGQSVIQLMLEEPVNDIFAITVNEKPALLTSGTDSFLYIGAKDETVPQAMHSASVDIFYFRMTGMPAWKKAFNDLTPESTADVTLEVEGQEINTTKELLFAHSEVFKAMFAHDTKEKISSIIEIEDFPFEVVQEMVRFMIHGYCCQWTKWHSELAAIADKYIISGMKALVVQKKELIEKL